MPAKVCDEIIQPGVVQDCKRSLSALLKYCRQESWAGYDPYDGLNSPLLNALSLKNKFLRTAFTQALKRSPINLRRLLGIKKVLNPKGVALAARAVMLLKRCPELTSSGDAQGVYTSSTEEDHLASGLEKDFLFLMSSLQALRSRMESDACWGYNFDWQSRAFFAPRGTPNVVCTTVAAHACLDRCEYDGNEEALNIAVSSCRFLLDRLNRSEDSRGYCFSYTPLDRSRVHNVNLLAAELLARVFAATNKEEFRDAAERAVEYTIGKQRGDGWWPYGEDPSQGWVDGFHTGFILVSLRHIREYLQTDRWNESLSRAARYYSKSFFLADGTPKYYHESLYPIDVHSSAQAVITFVEMDGLTPAAKEMADKSVEWAIKNLQDPAGFFYFQRSRFYTIKVPYIRWAQAWMLYALSLYLSRSGARKHG